MKKSNTIPSTEADKASHESVWGSKAPPAAPYSEPLKIENALLLAEPDRCLMESVVRKLSPASRDTWREVAKDLLENLFRGERQWVYVGGHHVALMEDKRCLGQICETVGRL